jgi:hypothetical protein
MLLLDHAVTHRVEFLLLGLLARKLQGPDRNEAECKERECVAIAGQHDPEIAEEQCHEGLADRSQHSLVFDAEDKEQPTGGHRITAVAGVNMLAAPLRAPLLGLMEGAAHQENQNPVKQSGSLAESGPEKGEDNRQDSGEATVIPPATLAHR